MLKRLKTQYLSILVVLVTLGVLAVSTAKAQGVLDPRLLRQNGATSGQALKWNGTVWAPANDTDTGITSLNGLTGATQTFADVDDTNVTVAISSTGTTHTWTLGWTSVLAVGRGGTGADLSATGGANQFVRQSSAGGAFTVSAIADADVPNSITIDLAATATALAANPNDCSAGQYATAIAASGNLTCAQIAFSEISGSVTDGQVPNTITLDNITQITTRSHASLQDLTADDHTQYGLLAGRSGGQTLIGGTGAGDDLTLNTTSNVTKGSYFFTDLTSNGFMTTSGGTGVVSITSPNGGTDVTADLEEETHASEHAENAADELLVENLGTACTTGQHFTSDGSGGVDCATVSAGGWTRGSAVDATNGGANDLTSFTVLSGLSSPDQIEIAFSGVSLNGTDNFQIQIGDSGGIETSGYESTSIHIAIPGGSLSGHSDTAAYAFRGGAADMVTSGSLVITRVDGNTWTINGTFHNVSAGLGFFWIGTTSGVKTLSGTLTQVLMKSASTNTFDGGTVTGMHQ